MSNQTITTPTGLPADAQCSIQRGEDTIDIYLSHGGEQFPWAECNGRVILGPPPEEATMTHDGVDMSTLNWEVSDYWVIEAVDDSGSEITLSPEEYASVVRAG